MVSAGSGNLTDSCGGDGSSGEGGLGEVLAGVAIAVVASVGINIGNNVQVLAGPRCIRSQGGLGWPGIGVRVRVRGGLRLQGFASTAAQPAPPEGSASGQSLDPRARAPSSSSLVGAPRVRRRWGSRCASQQRGRRRRSPASPPAPSLAMAT